MIAATVLAVAPARRVVSGWFGAGRIEVEVDRSADPTGLPSFTAPAERIDRAAAGEFLGRPMPPVDGSPLGVPSDWWTLPEGGVLVSWPDGGTSLWVVVTNGDGRRGEEGRRGQRGRRRAAGDSATAASP